MVTVNLTEPGLVEFKSALDKLNRKAAKYGFPQATVHKHIIEVIQDDVDGDYIQHTVTVNGNWAVKINGWQLAGIIDTYSLAETIIKIVPGFDVVIPERYRHTNARLCEHCNIDRYRKDVYLVYNGTEFKQVGSSCLADYLGNETAEQIAQLAELIGAVEYTTKSQNYDGFGIGDRLYDLELYLAFVVESMRATKGYIKKDQGYNPTSQDAMARMKEFMKTNKREYWPKHNDHVVACDVVQWAKDYYNNARTDYDLNMRAIFKSEHITAKYIGFAASAVPAFYRNQVKQAEVAASQFVGAVKDKLTLQLTVKHVQEINNGFNGITTLIKMIDQSGNLFVWFASGEKTTIKRDSVIKLTGTIKAHQEFQGIKQTVLTRCKVV